MMTGDKVSAADAEKMGMIYKVIDDVTFAEDSFLQAQTLAQMPTQAMAFTKEALNNSFTNSLTQQLAQEDLLQRNAAATSDYTEGITAFIEKRKPIFTGK